MPGHGTVGGNDAGETEIISLRLQRIAMLAKQMPGRALTSLAHHMRKALDRKWPGHYNYFGITGNFDAIARSRSAVLLVWKKWVGRRSQQGYVPWDHLVSLMERFPLPRPRIVHPYCREPAVFMCRDDA